LRCTDVPPTRTIEGLRVACVERVLLDIAATVSADAAGTALDDALRRRITTLARMKSYLASAGGAGRDGTSALTRLLGARDDGNEKVRSDFETKMLTVMRSIRLPYEPNHQVTTEGHRYFLDFAFPGPKVGIECHSAGWHKSQSRWVKDIERSRRLARAGWLMLYFAWAEVISAPDRVRFEIEAALGSRGALLATRNSSWRPLSESS
jgi:very-short-patch-repair endonuclease